MALLRFLIIGLVAGWVVGKIRRGKGYGLFGNLLVGTLGALIGGFLGGLLGSTPGNVVASVAMAVAGAVILFFVVDAVRPKRGSKGESDE